MGNKCWHLSWDGGFKICIYPLSQKKKSISWDWNKSAVYQIKLFVWVYMLQKWVACDFTELYSKPETPGSILIWCFLWEPIYMTESLRSKGAILYLIRTSQDMNFTSLDSKLILQRRRFEFGFFFHYSWPQSLRKWQGNWILQHSFGGVNDKWSEILLLRSHCVSYWSLLFPPLTSFSFSPLSLKKLLDIGVIKPVMVKVIFCHNLSPFFVVWCFPLKNLQFDPFMATSYFCQH